ncbi:MAG: carboxylating nicotinate-nucleotide diphosphorylase [candidate division Zixibacteria bacterium]|nr:carboxylating nicotinate-nucleotide diphosphorylase [candidate division Zixibacteria bacterium]
MPTNVDWDDVVTRALEEDLGAGDVTTELLGVGNVPARAAIVAHDDGIMFGMEVARRVFRQLERKLVFKAVIEDGQKFTAGRAVARLQGPAGAILAGERVALNFIQRLSGIATYTAAFVARADNVAVTVLDTRKTTPGLRSLEKAAVKAGGGENHRAGLYDGIMIKDNHKRLYGGVGEAVKRALEKRRSRMPIFVEVETVEEAEAAAAAGADVIMLDNFDAEAAHLACLAVGGRAAVEVSGGVKLANVAAFARSGASRISVGALTHSAPALDFSLEVEA